MRIFQINWHDKHYSVLANSFMKWVEQVVKKKNFSRWKKDLEILTVFKKNQQVYVLPRTEFYRSRIRYCNRFEVFISSVQMNRFIWFEENGIYFAWDGNQMQNILPECDNIYLNFKINGFQSQILYFLSLKFELRLPG